MTANNYTYTPNFVFSTGKPQTVTVEEALLRVGDALMDAYKVIAPIAQRLIITGAREAGEAGIRTGMALIRLLVVMLDNLTYYAPIVARKAFMFASEGLIIGWYKGIKYAIRGARKAQKGMGKLARVLMEGWAMREAIIAESKED